MITLYTTTWCGYCKMAKRFLSEKGLDFKEIDIESEGISRETLREITGGWTVPQVVINGKSIGGYDNLIALYNAGELSLK